MLVVALRFFTHKNMLVLRLGTTMLKAVKRRSFLFQIPPVVDHQQQRRVGYSSAAWSDPIDGTAFPRAILKREISAWGLGRSCWAREGPCEALFG